MSPNLLTSGSGRQPQRFPRTKPLVGEVDDIRERVAVKEYLPVQFAVRDGASEV